ncbi:hypothetical protein OS493_026410 [Desmophyllum pertusum]|uniref:Uncharacterized protein n=1 Tax=Desmophyllum pertusum TaxID=174260 RepID=A0A9W9ZA61_9CNID|nr:hypothetical protein OS493_026410 [Desmophyllum pertusum]
MVIFSHSRMDDLKDADEQIDFQTTYVTDLVKESNYGYSLDVSEFLHAWFKYKMADITTYRDQSYTSKHTGTKSPVRDIPFMKAFDDSMQSFLKQ